MLETTVEDLQEKLEEIHGVSERNAELETAMAKMEIDKERLQDLLQDLHVSSPEPAGVPDTTSNENSSPEPAQVWEGDQYGIEKGSSKTLASLAESRRTQIALVEAHTQEREALLVRGNEYLERDQRGDSHPKVPIHTMVVFLAVTSTAQELCGGIVSLESYAGRQKRREKCRVRDRLRKRRLSMAISGINSIWAPVQQYHPRLGYQATRSDRLEG
ncbi:hypothetical protein Q9189_005758 [Teloschistes chrysophthalmus]